MSATGSLPSQSGVDTAGAAASDGLSGFLDLVGSLAGGSGSSPLGGVATALGGIEARLDIDLSGISERLPQAISTIRNALPEDSLAFVADIETAFRAAQDFLRESELVKQIRAGSDLEHTALALVDDVLALFRTRLANLAANLVGAEQLAKVQEALQLIDGLGSDYASHSGDLAAFVSKNLLGVPPDLLQAADAHVASSLSVLQSFSESALGASVTPARNALAAAAKDVAEAIKNFDIGDASLYGQLEIKLQALDTALGAGFDALEACYGAASAAVDGHAWETVFGAYGDLLNALPLDGLPNVDDVVDQLAGVLENFLSGLSMALSPEDLAARITRLSDSVQNAFAQSPLGQVRQTLLDFLASIKDVIDQIPAEAAQQAVAAMLTRVRRELDDLGIASIRSSIADAFQDAGDFIDDNLNDGLLDDAKAALDGLLQQAQGLPIADVGEQLAQAVDTIGGVVQQLEADIQGGLDEVRELLSALDDLSFQPVSDEVIGEIDTLKAKLRSIRPDALSDAEKLAIQAGLAILRAIDLEGMINDQLKNGFAALGNEIKGLINRVLAAWEDFRHRLGDFDPNAVMGPLSELLDQVTGAVRQLNGAALLAPLYGLVDDLVKKLSALSPGSLLDGLQGPYTEMMAFVERANPDVWVQPLRALHAEIDTLIDYVDITPLLGKLEDKEKELFAQARQAILDGLDSVHLPAPLDAFYAQLKTVALSMTDALFGDPGEGIRQVNVSIGQNLKLSSLFLPLDMVFDQLLGMLDGIPRDDLLAVMEGLRKGIGLALAALDPRNVVARLREGQARLADLSPAMAAAAIPALPAMYANLSARLELAPPSNQAAAASLTARFNLTLRPLDRDDASSRLVTLTALHRQLVDALRLKINSLEASGAQAAYARLNQNLGRLLPGFLRQSEPLTYERIRAGLAEFRPSRKAQRLDSTLDLFLSRLRPMEAALGPAINGFFRIIKESALIIHPAALKDAVKADYDALRAKLHVLDPDELAASLKENVYDPLIDPLKAIDPAAIKAQLDSLYQHVLDSLSGKAKGFLDQIKLAVDAVLAEVRKAIADVLKALTDQIAAILQKLQDLLGQIDSLIVDDLFGRLLRTIDNLETSFNQELDRVRHEFDSMLDAIPLGSGTGASAAVGV